MSCEKEYFEYLLPAIQELLEDGIEVSSLKKRFDAQPDVVKKSDSPKVGETTTISSAQKGNSMDHDLVCYFFMLEINQYVKLIFIELFILCTFIFDD